MDEFFYVYNDTYKKLTFFNVIDITMMLIWLIIIFGFAFYRKSRNSELDYYKYYLPNLSFKIIFSLIFSLYYILVVGGGDTIAYWDLAGCMNNLFWESPQFYFNNLFHDFSDPGFISRYNEHTGYPPYWIMRETQGFFLAKIVSFFSFISGNSFLVITILFATITANVSWRFFKLVITVFPNLNRWLVYSVLFIPSVGFWCTGISKDTLVFISILVIVTHGFKLLLGISRFKLWSILIILFYLWLLYNVRSVILMILIVSFLIAASARFSNRYNNYVYMKRLIQVLVGGIGLAIFFFAIQSYGQEVSLDRYIKEAEVVQKDFANNETYTGKKYTLEITDYTMGGMLSVMPAAVLAGVLRPFIWESLTPTLLLNGIESTIFVFLIIRFFRSGVRQKINQIRSNEFLLFCFFFVIIFGFVTGFSSVIFGVLVRLRAPLLIFFGIILSFMEKAEPIKK